MDHSHAVGLEETPHSLDTTLPGASDTVSEGRSEAHGAGPAEPGSRIGRYVVLGKLGTGAMGVVHVAYDPELDRKVALKLLKPRGGDPADARARLQREAQALAKLGHPNVVAVHDVGIHAGQLFVSMEFVAGQTLHQWMEQDGEASGPRPWRQVLARFIDAGRGLAAAHAAGLVHRDFKPDNVMLGDDGRVRVMDFGLARGKDEVGEASEVAEVGQRAALGTTTGGLLVSRLTQTGAVLGTPAYMAPEQFHGELADARSDQFGFCVSLYEALYGERPFAGDTVGVLAVELLEREAIRSPPKRSGVPSWVRAIVVRGLAKQPDERWPSMEPLLDALSHDPAISRRRWGAAALVLGLLGGATWALWSASLRDAQTCANMERHLDGVWDEARRAELGAAFERAPMTYAEDTWTRVEPYLDRYAAAWVQARAEACEATHRGEQSGELLDLRMACLDERLVRLRATVDVFALSDDAVVGNAVQTAANLPGLERCADLEALTAAIPPPEKPEVAARVEALTVHLAEAETRLLAGVIDEGLEFAAEVRAEAEALAYEPLMARAWLAEGKLQAEAGAYEEAETSLRRAYASALGQNMTAEAAIAASVLVHVVGTSQARHADGRRWAEHAEPLARASGDEDLQATFANYLAVLAQAEGAPAEARAGFMHALTLWERSVGPEHPNIGNALANLGVVAHAEGNYSEARTNLERALEIRQKAVGPRHPDVAYTLTNLGAVAKSQGDLEAARRYHERALPLFEAVYGPKHMTVAASLNNLASVIRGEGELDEARNYIERAVSIFEEALGPRHPSLASALNNLGGIARDQGKAGEARRHFERALSIKEEALDPKHPSVATTLTSIGSLMVSEGELEQARPILERALEIREQALAPEHPHVAESLVWLARLAHLEGELDRAQRDYERALALQVDILERDDPSLAATRFALARVLWEVGRERGRAGELAALARETYAGAGEGKADELAKVEAWLDQR